ncbi:lysophosphatidylcholine acyltransferase 1 [Anaeramoeba flamelloides]|uniref:Lysophosphatidylcholine acyltransferase 1 n=1 Tax=Anaeramoeba flamelloides TaxID=1746091 RepID=A0ABQ8YG96_9EUKA|nr:lysophosphatidylcholine acyltransferase 1 [Anaeramoeba flamelloides]
MSVTTEKEKEKEYDINTVTEKELNEIPRFKPWVLYNCSFKEKVLMICSFIFLFGWLRLIIQIFWHFFLAETLRLLTIGQDPNKPYSKFRKTLVSKWSSFWSRIMMFTLGYWWIEVKGKENLKKFKKQTKNRIFISNHQTLEDVPLLNYLVGCSFLSKEALSKVPLIGTTNTLIQGMYMSRKKSNTWLKEEIQNRYKNDDYIPLCVFAEGTTTNGKGVLQFRKGLFESGYTIHPIKIQFKGGLPFKFSEVSYTYQSVPFLFISILCNIINFVEVTYLEPYEPSEEEKKDPILFANNVREKYIEQTGLPPYQGSYRDFVEYEKVLKTIRKRGTQNKKKTK